MDLKIIEFDKYKHCRVCLQTYSEMCNIFGEGCEYNDMLRECGRVEVEMNDGLPVVICEYCVQEMIQAHHFLTKCQDADRKLRLSIAENIKVGFEVVCNQSIVIKAEPDRNDIKLCDEDNIQHNDVSSDKYDSNREEVNTKKTQKQKVFHKKKTLSYPKKCSQCSVVMKCKSAMMIHMRCHTNERPFQCAHCGECFKTKGVLKAHMAIHRDKSEDLILNPHLKFECEHCNKVFVRKCNLMTHTRTHTGEMPYSCQYCSRTFSQISNMHRHVKLHTGEKTFKCNVCQKKFHTRDGLKKHSISHSNERNFECSECSLLFKTKQSLRSHIAVIHENSRRVVCDQCGMSFSTAGNLKGHLLSIHSENSGHCYICNKIYSNIKEHNLQHTGETPYQCEYCEKKFSAKKRLKSHFSTHSNPEKFHCGYEKCSKTFRMKAMLVFHILKYHKKQTPYICKHCNRGFYRLSDLKRHLKLNHSDEPNILEDIKNVEIDIKR